MTTFVHSRPYDKELPTWAANTTSLSIRVSIHSDLATQASQQVLGTWRHAGLPTQSVDGEEYLGCASRQHGISLSIPEAPPKRIPSAAKMFDMICVLDSRQDERNRQDGYSSWRTKVAILRTLAGVFIKCPVSLVGVLKPAIAYHRSLGLFSLGFPADRHSFAELFPTRLHDFPCCIMTQSLAFGLGLKLSTKDVASLHCLNLVSTGALALSNDILSWPKEKLEHTSSNKDTCSSMTIFLRQPGSDERQALLQCRRRLMQFEMKASRLADELLSNPRTHFKIRKMAQGYLLLIAGLAVWQCVCKRYSSTGPTANLVKEVLELQLPLAALDDAFEAELELIMNGYMSIYRKHFN